MLALGIICHCFQGRGGEWVKWLLQLCCSGSRGLLLVPSDGLSAERIDRVLGQERISLFPCKLLELAYIIALIDVELRHIEVGLGQLQGPGVRSYNQV